MSEAREAIIIGAGHNGLVAAGLLARKEIRPLVLEARDHIGGMLGDQSFRVSPMPFSLRPEFLRALDIDLPAVPMATLVASPSGKTIRVSGNRVEGCDTADAEAYEQLARRLARQAEALSGMLLRPPPSLDGNSFRELLSLARTGLKLRGLGKTGLRDLLRIALSNVHDLIDDEIGDGPLGALLAMDATLGGAMGPRSPGTVLPLLYRMTANAGQRMMPAGGPTALVKALASKVETAGGEVRTNAPVKRILVEDDRVAGVCLESGEIIRAPLVLSTAAPGTTLLEMLGPEYLDAEFVRRCRKMASAGMVARLDFELSAAPALADGTQLTASDRLVIAENAAAVEAAFNAAKYRGLPERPVMEACYDAGRGLLSVSAQFIPCNPEGGWTKVLRLKLEKAVKGEIARIIPDFSKLVLSTVLMTPQDIETAYRVPGGHWHHGEFRIDQLLMLRPFDGASNYRMPVEGLYLCGAGAHPGGDISGAPGFNGARAALAGRRR
ncbi:MAG: NAD(P)/FAD-dependent oxidoreductase [Nitratireductor sp.]|nr:NAD(P)/FAD-dependent oxidoreductase [Nitratireductor sp.]